MAEGLKLITMLSEFFVILILAILFINTFSKSCISPEEHQKIIDQNNFLNASLNKTQVDLSECSKDLETF